MEHSRKQKTLYECALNDPYIKSLLIYFYFC
jgi:hypothetical protein